MSKLFEKILANQLTEHLESNNLLNEYQFGFRSKRSTASAILYFTEHICQSLNSGQITIFINLCKAFDTVNHCILLNKLKYFNWSFSAMEMVASYLSKWSQLVHIEQVTSSLLESNIGVPQGSILGPLLFKLLSVCKLSETIMYADDTVIFTSDSNITKINNKLSTDLDEIVKWLYQNHLTVNTKKTECMYFRSDQKNVLLTTR